LKKIATTASVPVNADFGRFRARAKGVAVNVRRAVSSGIAGLSISSTGDKAEPLFDFQLSVERITAARAAIDRRGQVL
jgi:2-methylisocitrate lyase-like PEP mutase family enzyme